MKRQDSMQNVIRTSRGLDLFLHEAAQNFEVFSNIQEWNLKTKTYNGWCPFQGLSNGTTLIIINPIWPDGTFKGRDQWEWIGLWKVAIDRHLFLIVVILVIYFFNLAAIFE